MAIRSIIGVVALMLLVGAGMLALAFSLRPDARPVSLQSILPGTSDSRGKNPADIINLSAWKVTLPVSTDPEFPTPLEIRQPELASYRLEPWFMSSRDQKGVIFRAPVNAPTTGNTDYPRSELREMTSDGTKVVYWSSKEGTHTLTLDEAITAVPKGKPDVVAGQIHGDDDDLLVVRLEYPKLFIARGKKNVYTIDENYVLGKRFTVRFVAENGTISAYVNGSSSPAYSFEKAVDQAYFKAGVYTQSNCETEGMPELCNADNYGEVVIYQAKTTHER